MNCAVAGTSLGVVGRLGADVHRVPHVGAGQRHDRGRHGRREQHRLAGLRRLWQDAARRRAGSRGRASRRPRRAPATCTWEMSRARRLHRSMRRPGVPTTMSTPASSASSWPLVGDAAVDGEHPEAAVACWRGGGRRRPGARARGSARRSAPAACPAASRRSRGPWATTLRCRTGMPKASVLPVPVRAWPIRSVPIRATERVISWMGNGVVMPARSSASQISGSTPSSRKVVTMLSSLVGCRFSIGPCGGPRRSSEHQRDRSAAHMRPALSRLRGNADRGAGQAG